MAQIDNILIPSLTLDEVAAPSTPAATSVVVYAKANGLVYSKDDGGVETLMSSGPAAGAVATDAIWDAAGDLAQGTGANTAAKLSAGTTKMVLTSAGAAAANAWQYPPGYEFDYAQITSSGSPTATVEASSTTIITGNAVTYDGSTIIMVEFWCPDARPNDSSGAWMAVSLFEGATQLARIVWMSLPTVLAASIASQRHPLVGRFRLTPSAAAHTYHIKAHVSTGTGYIGAGAGGTGTLAPAYMRITKVS